MAFENIPNYVRMLTIFGNAQVWKRPGATGALDGAIAKRVTPLPAGCYIASLLVPASGDAPQKVDFVAIFSARMYLLGYIFRTFIR